jgi:hypothetical protein
MQIKYAITGLTSVTIVGIVGIALMSFSPKGCSCESINDMLLASAGMEYPAEDPKPEQLEEGLNKNFAGKIIRGGSDPYYFSSCKQESLTRVTCHIATSQSNLLERGYDIVFETDESGVLLKSHVSGYTAWL